MSTTPSRFRTEEGDLELVKDPEKETTEENTTDGEEVKSG